MKTVGEIIREKRLANGWSQDRLAKEIGIGSSGRSIGHWERGQFFPNIMCAWALADVFGCTLDELCGREVKADEQSQTH